MKRILIASLAALSLSVVACTTAVAVRPPRPGMVLIQGVWVMPPRPNAVWVPGHSVRLGYFHRAWVAGHWVY